MFEKEEEKLTDYKKSYDNISIPMDALDDAIMAGFQKAKVEKIRKPGVKKWVYSVAAAVLFIVGFLTSVRLSPVFADYISVIPGMEKIVELIRHDKGMIAAIENEYYQELGVSQKHDGVEFIIDGAIFDENGLVLFYTVKSDDNVKWLSLDRPRLQTKDGEPVKYSSASYNPSLQYEEDSKSENGTLEFFFDEPLPEKELQLLVDISGNKLASIMLPFTLTEQVKTKKVYELDETVTIAGQKITIESVTVQPIRTAIHVKMDPNNTMKILDFDDIRLVDENGEMWNKIASGTTASHISDHERIIYLQSNYFREPKELFVVMNKLQAIDQDEAQVVVDIENEQILKQPKGNLISHVKVDGDEIGFFMDMEEEFPFSIFNEVRDAEGELIEQNYWFTSGLVQNNLETFGVNIKDLENYHGPLSFEITFFPNWIEGDAKVKIK